MLSDKNAEIAYFSMEIGIDQRLPTYSGGLGILAADTIRACADLKVPLVAVTLLYRKGYFLQRIDGEGNQQEFPCEWNPHDFLRLLPPKVTVNIEGRTVLLQAWEYLVRGVGGHLVPIIFLDTDLPQNIDFDRSLSDYLYGGDKKYRLAQEIVLGIGGVRMLWVLGCNKISKYHMNEGHSSLLTLELLQQHKFSSFTEEDKDAVRKMCVFTTHTPVPAGHDKFDYGVASQLLDDFVPLDFLRSVGGENELNMTCLALHLSHYVNGVAKSHGAVSQGMFPGHQIDSITNGVYSPCWVCEPFKKLYDKYIPGWVNDPFSLRYALSIPGPEIREAHREAKRRLLDRIAQTSGVRLDAEVLTIGFARRATAYKRPDLIFFDEERLLDICQRAGKFQLIFSGKAHPRDMAGKELIKKIVSFSRRFGERLRVVYLENYHMGLAKLLVSGVDLWLNTPLKPQEASGTSGMKAAHNGIPSLSILDGWWIEGCIENLTGWAIGGNHEDGNNTRLHAQSLYDKLEKTILPAFYGDGRQWVEIMRHTIAINASFFNTHRMVQQYVLNAYL